MPGQPPSDAAPSAVDGDGIRVIRRTGSASGDARRALGFGLGVLVLGVLAGVWLSVRSTGTGEESVPMTVAAPATAATAAAQTRSVSVRPAVPGRDRRPGDATTNPQESVEDFELPSLDPDDIAAYIRPGDEEPTMAELIEALRAAGIHDGIAAFNPPGTSPPLEGLAVPEDFELPEGYVRHYQATDQGEAIEAILMFSPDYEFYDESGRRVSVPDDGVVPEDLAPPGLPIRRVRVPSP